ncbi:MAG: UDP-N-acetylmuramoyl-tripeptide--D-alanyl-D-alanine ligase [Verrucomicrobia bacterium]|nr:UDP-N-acetylmuramoyl-tripeptide--D-alanyl-D-alanine ligase [Verrucomicrobiota bacterium]
MEARTLNYAAEACGGKLHGGFATSLFTRVCTDSRAVRPGDLFVALQGERFDGHEFASHVAKQGAAALVMGFSRAAVLPPGAAGIFVDDTRAALGKLAARYRKDFDLPIVAVAGSNGKTSTKELLAALLRQAGPTLWSEASFNNDIGVPLTLLRLEKSHRAAVLETGTNHPGELAPLLEMIRPRFGIITCIGREHLEFFGDLHGVAREEGALAEGLPADGCLFVNGDSPLMDEVASRSRARVVRAGFGENCEWCARDIRVGERGTTFVVESPRAEFCAEFSMPLLGRHQVVNALLAMATAAELGVSVERVRAGLTQAAPAKMRLQLGAVNGIRVLNDAYNANADSMIAALETLRDLSCAGRRVAVLGDMAELGEQSGPAHAEIGRFAALTGVGRLICVGQNAATLARAAREAGLADVREFASAEAAAMAIGGLVSAGDLVLFKASRATRLERVVEALGGTQVRTA